jgi:hypothetical protein
MLRLSTECYVKGIHPQSVEVIAIRMIASVEDDRRETDVRPASSGMDAFDRHGFLRELSVGIVPIFLQHRMSFSTAVVPQLKLYHLDWLVSLG